jgi:N-acetylglucosamine kinase-like BadF-type ATPase
MTTRHLVIGIDGGGSTTVAWLAQADGSPDSPPLGQGQSGPSNPQSVRRDEVGQNLDRAVDAAFHDAGLSPGTVRSACIALAGGDRPGPQREIAAWANQRQLADHVCVVNDALPVLAYATADSVGICLIAGTGSIAFGRDALGQTARAGGWGYLLGDEGSSYAISVAALRAVARSLDGRADHTALCDLLLGALGVSEPSELIPTVYARRGDRAWIAGLAPLVLTAAQQEDPTARRIVDQASRQLGSMVVAVADQLSMKQGDYLLALAGGVLVHSQLVRDGLRRRLAEVNRTPRDCRVVDRPVAGSVCLARAGP